VIKERGERGKVLYFYSDQSEKYNPDDPQFVRLRQGLWKELGE
jgi:hypothetical protein